MRSTPRRILAATDFSPTGERARAVALDLARRFAARLDVLHVRVLLDDPDLGEQHQLELQRMFAATDDEKRQALATARDEDAVVARPHLARGISAAEVIVETCAELSCDLIVMGTHGRRGISHLLLGSVAEKVLRTSPVPVLTVRPEAALPDGMRRILVPHDFSDHSARAVRIAAAWARRLGSALTLLHAVEPVVYPEFYAADLPSSDMLGRLRSRSEEALLEAAAELSAGASCDAVVRVGRAGDTIVTEASPDRYDLVIMGTRGLSGLEHLLLGSVAENVLRRAALPVLAVREGALEPGNDAGSG